MNTEELLEYLKQEVKTFINLEIIEEGIAYHYTNHFSKIEKDKKFLGAEINKNLDKTQQELISKPATNDPGVVFAYENLEDAIEEGFDCDIIEIKYKKAISANHTQENELGNMVNSFLTQLGDSDNFEEDLKTILIINTEIISFQIIET